MSARPAIGPASPRRSGTATWHLSREAVTLALPDVMRMSDRECLDYLVLARFGGWSTVRCAHCGSIGKHYWRSRERRWKCAACDKTFSVTSGTVFAHRKLSLQQLVGGALLWVNSAAGQPALELRRHLNITYNTAFTLQHKLRESLVRGYNVGLVNGDLEMDGAHISARRANEKRGKPQGWQRFDDATSHEELEATMLTQRGQQDARTRKLRARSAAERAARPATRRIFFSLRRRGNARGRGAALTRVAIGLVEEAPVAGAILHAFANSAESTLSTDTLPAYTGHGKKFRRHYTVEHSRRMVGPDGENNNQAEEINWRFGRAERGTYLNIEPKYMLDYAAEIAFRADTRRVPNGTQLRLALNLAMSVGESEFWRGFTHGRHRTVELTHPVPLPAPASGPPKGRHPISSRNGRPPS